MKWIHPGPGGRLCLLLLLLPAPAAAPQKRAPRPRPVSSLLLLKVKKAHLGTGKVLSPAAILVRRGWIQAVGKDLVPPKGAKVLDLGDLEAAPGLVDPWALTFLSPSDRKINHGPGEPTASGLVRLRPGQARELLRSGVTLLCVTPPGPDGPGPGLTVVSPSSSGAPRVLRPLAALVIRFSKAGPRDPLAPLKAYKSLKKAFEKARDYKKKRDRARKEEKEYQKKWKDYLEALKKLHLGKKKKPGKGKGAPPGKAQGKGSKPASRPAGPPASRKEGPRSRPAGKGRAKAASQKPGKPPVRPKRPAPFKADPAQEALAAALEKKIPVRIEAHTRLEVKKALQLAWEFELRAVLVEPWEVEKEDLDRASLMKVVVLYGPLDRPALPFGKLGFRPGLLSLWTKAGCPVALGTRGVLSPRFLRDQAALARSMGLTAGRALQAVTLAAARASGVENLAGSLEKGKRADILFFAGDPADPSLPPKRVMVGGRFLHKEVRL